MAETEKEIRESAWIPLDSAPLLKPREEIIGGVPTQVLNSPLSLPVALRAKYDPEEGLLTLEFRYAIDEGAETVKLPGRRVVRVGKRSGRVLSVQVAATTPESSIQELIESVSAVLADLQYHRISGRHHVHSYNAQVAGEAVHYGKPRLVPAVAMAY